MENDKQLCITKILLVKKEAAYSFNSQLGPGYMSNSSQVEEVGLINDSLG